MQEIAWRQPWGKGLRCQVQSLRMWRAVRAPLRRSWKALAMMIVPCQSHCHSLLAPREGEHRLQTPDLTRICLHRKI